jgi:hypothetical protein
MAIGHSSMIRLDVTTIYDNTPVCEGAHSVNRSGGTRDTNENRILFLGLCWPAAGTMITGDTLSLYRNTTAAIRAGIDGC